MAETIDVTLKVWRQPNASAQGQMETYPAKGIRTDASFLEMLDIVNEQMIEDGKEPIAFEHDCREGICGACSLVINGIPTGRSRRRPPASSTCGTSRTATRSTSSRGAPRRSRSSRT